MDTILLRQNIKQNVIKQKTQKQWCRLDLEYPMEFGLILQKYHRC